MDWLSDLIERNHERELKQQAQDEADERKARKSLEGLLKSRSQRMRELETYLEKLKEQLSLSSKFQMTLELQSVVSRYKGLGAVPSALSLELSKEGFSHLFKIKAYNLKRESCRLEFIRRVQASLEEKPELQRREFDLDRVALKDLDGEMQGFLGEVFAAAEAEELALTLSK